MKRLSYIITVLVLTTCSPQTDNKETVQQSTVELDKDMLGKWINTTLFDSTLQQRKIAPWTNHFYGDLIIEIKNSKTVLTEGNMDGGESSIEIIDSRTFIITGRTDNPKVQFDSGKKLLTLTSDYQTCLFRPLAQTDNVEIIGHEQKFDDYFKSKLFEGFDVNIGYLWNGFETHQPFDFDAIGVKTDSAELEYYAWELNQDTLLLYQTIRSTNQESGFFEYQRGKLKEKKEKTAHNKG